MYPYSLMPNPKGSLRLTNIGCDVKFKKTKISVPMEIKDYEDYVPGTRYPKMKDRTVWLVYIEIPNQLMDDIKEGSIDLAGKSIDLDELDNSYDEDLDKDGTDSPEENQDLQLGNQPMANQQPQNPAAAAIPGT